MPAFGEFKKLFYPGLGPEETKTWRRWCVDHEQEWDSFEYRVAVGEGVRAPRGTYSTDVATDDKYVALQKALTQRKIDVVARRGSLVMLIEIKDRADVRSLGQLQLYEDLYSAAHPDQREIDLAIVCRFVGSDMGSTLDDKGIAVYVVTV